MANIDELRYLTDVANDTSLAEAKRKVVKEIGRAHV